MTWFYEESLPGIITGILVVLGSVLVWLHTGRRPFLLAAVGGLVLCFVAVMVERGIETDGERIDAVLHEIARNVARNDLPAALSHVHPSAPIIRAQAESELPRYNFSDVTIKSNLRITFDDPSAPTEATARFNASVSASHRDFPLEHRRAVRYVTVVFRRDGDDWKVVAYDHQEPELLGGKR
ncbi:MAG: hypothetical protein AB7O38_28450 [Pirellulaceae bacterium]